jgi:aldose 1-epimerase
MAFETIVTEESGYSVIKLKDKSGGCEAEIYSFGGLLNRFRIPTKEGLINVIQGFDSVVNAHANITNGFKSTKLSPFVCRMHKGQYTYGAEAYTIQKYFLGEHAIHGLVYDESFQIKKTAANTTEASVTLQFDYKGTDKGYPFPYAIIINWKLESQNKLTVTTTVSHTNLHTIPMADGWHPYFSLGGLVDEWTLQFDSDTQLEYDADLLPTGKKFPDDRFVGGCLLKGIELDNSFSLSANALQPKCVLQNNAFRLTIEPDKNYPILQIYIPPQRTSIAIENLSGAPDNFNNGMGLILLPPDEEKTFSTSYSVVALL